MYTGSHNFSVAADSKNAENLLLIRDRRVAVSYAIEALAMSDHYSFRDAEANAKKQRRRRGTPCSPCSCSCRLLRDRRRSRGGMSIGLSLGNSVIASYFEFEGPRYGSLLGKYLGT